jgi:hypothetical protein
MAERNTPMKEKLKNSKQQKTKGCIWLSPSDSDEDKAAWAEFERETIYSFDRHFMWLLNCVFPLKDGEPCGHPGCLHHLTHPCEGCGRIAGRNKYEN